MLTPEYIFAIYFIYTQEKESTWIHKKKNIATY